MKFELLKQSHLKRNILIGVVVVLILAAIILTFTRAKYRTTQSIPLVNGTINYSLADLNIVAITVDGESVDTIPEGDYELTGKSYCTVNGEKNSSISLSYDSSTQTLQVIPFTTKGTKCYLDFVTATTKKVNTVLGEIVVNLDRPDFSKTAQANCEGIENCEETNGIYEAEDDYGTSYYYRGAVTNNYVQFAGYYWRIIRINGDGSVRIIYDGTSAHANGDSSTDRQIGTSAFNSTNGSYTGGFTYELNTQRPSFQNGGTASTIKEVLDSWYTTNIINKVLDDQVVSVPGFCNDREMASGYSWSAQPSEVIRYAAYERLYTNKAPTLRCSNNLDLYTTKIGLITADELTMAGSPWYSDLNSNNDSFYLYTGQCYWTITPFDIDRGISFNFFVSSPSNNQLNGLILNMHGVRPVINLSADVTLTGSGTATDPYIVS